MSASFPYISYPRGCPSCQSAFDDVLTERLPFMCKQCGNILCQKCFTLTKHLSNGALVDGRNSPRSAVSATPTANLNGTNSANANGSDEGKEKEGKENHRGTPSPAPSPSPVPVANASPACASDYYCNRCRFRGLSDSANCPIGVHQILKEQISLQKKNDQVMDGRPDLPPVAHAGLNGVLVESPKLGPHGQHTSNIAAAPSISVNGVVMGMAMPNSGRSSSNSHSHSIVTSASASSASSSSSSSSLSLSSSGAALPLSPRGETVSLHVSSHHSHSRQPSASTTSATGFHSTPFAGSFGVSSANSADLIDDVDFRLKATSLTPSPSAAANSSSSSGTFMSPSVPSSSFPSDDSNVPAPFRIITSPEGMPNHHHSTNATDQPPPYQMATAPTTFFGGAPQFATASASFPPHRSTSTSPPVPVLPQPLASSFSGNGSTPASPPHPHHLEGRAASTASSMSTTGAVWPPIGLAGSPSCQGSASYCNGCRHCVKDIEFWYLISWPLISDIVDSSSAAANSMPPKPTQVKKLDFREEEKALKSVLTESRKRITFTKRHATVECLSDAKLFGARILHYTGHGLPNCLAFENSVGKAQPMDPHNLQDLISSGAGSDKLRLVFVAACQSEAAGNAFIKAGVHHVVATKIDSPVDDSAARTFMKNFYKCLFQGLTVFQSFSQAKAVTNSQHKYNEAKKFILLPDGEKHDECLYPRETAIDGGFIDCTKEDIPCNVPQPVDLFGYQYYINMQKIIEALDRRRVILLYGGKGVGKSTLAWSVGMYISDRRLYDGIYYVDLKQAKRKTSIIYELLNGIQSLDPAKSSPSALTSSASAFTSPSSSSSALTSPSSPSHHFSHIALPSFENSLQGETAFFFELKKAEKDAQKKYVIILDDADPLLDERKDSPNCVSRFVDDLLHSTALCKVILTSRAPPMAFSIGNHHVTHIHIEKGLSPEESVRLFREQLKGGNDISPSDLGSSRDRNEQNRHLAKHEVFSYLGGNPRRIHDAALLFKGENFRLQELKSKYMLFEEKNPTRVDPMYNFLQENKMYNTNNATNVNSAFNLSAPHPFTAAGAPNTSAAVSGAATSGMNLSNAAAGSLSAGVSGANPLIPLTPSPVPPASSPPINREGEELWRAYFPNRPHANWDEVKSALATNFVQMTGQDERPLSNDDFICVAEKFYGSAAIASVLAQAGNSVSASAIHPLAVGNFLSNFGWWQAFCNAIRSYQGLWLRRTPCRAIAGLMSRTRSEELLREKAPGTFLLRFTISSPSSLSIDYVSGHKAGMSGGRQYLVADMQHVLVEILPSRDCRLTLTDGLRTFPSLGQVVLQLNPITHCLEGPPKKDVFAVNE